MGLDPRPREQRAFIAELAERGVAALVIELGSSLQAIPGPLRDAAVKAGLPLVALRREVPFVRVTEAIHTELVNRQYGLLREGEEIKERLIAVMLDGDGLPELLQTLSEVIGNPVFLQSARGRMLFHAGGGDDLEAFESAGAQAGLEAPVPMGGGRPAGSWCCPRAGPRPSLIRSRFAMPPASLRSRCCAPARRTSCSPASAAICSPTWPTA